MENNLETLILSGLIFNEKYARKVMPFLKQDYFSTIAEKGIFNHIIKFVEKYNRQPSKEILEVNIQNSDLNESSYQEHLKCLSGLFDNSSSEDWLVDETEKFCKEKAVYNSILKSISIIEGKERQLSKDAIPSLLQEALGVSFDPSIGHDYIEDAAKRFEFNNRKEEKIPFDIDLLNKITRGGLSKKTLNVVLAGTGVGKSLFMCHMAANTLLLGKNVLYITLEMAEEKIAGRIDANLFDLEMDRVEDLPKIMFDERIKKLKNKIKGTLIVKEYPTTTAHVGDFLSLMTELRIKKNFNPDIIFIDYLNICASNRFKSSTNVNSYSYIKSIAEELRGFAVMCDLPIVTATQTTRGGYANTDFTITDTSESFGVPATADFLFGIATSDELEDLNQVMIKQMKNRYNDPTIHKRFMVGIDRSKMKLYNLEASAQVHLQDTGINMDEEKLDDMNFDDVFKSNKDFTGIKI